MIRILVVWNIVLTVIVVVVLASRFGVRNRASEDAQVVRATRLEIVDSSGKTKAFLGVDGTNSVPKLSLYDGEGREAAMLMLNSEGYGTIYFQSKQTEGRVSVGYLWGSDSKGSEPEDPLASWGIRVRATNGTQTSFGQLNNGLPMTSAR